ncbi:MAG TPA: hypothetical protein VFV66_06635, partial [Nonomuraea sp.]|nr:hypothetical protein [Nonomuraea sp.]
MAVAPSVGLGLWFGASGEPSQSRAIGMQVSLVLAPLLATAACIVRARRSPASAERVGWALLAASAGMWAAASVMFAWYFVVLARPPAFPSIADLLYLGFALPLAAAMVAFASTSTSAASRSRALLDG